VDRPVSAGGDAVGAKAPAKKKKKKRASLF